ncbi:sporulation histidine kinase inhibitor Sda [Radiobacillus sp. PE A8.2]
MFDSLSDANLIDAYEQAVHLGLDHDFIILLEKEIADRGLKVI